MKLTSQCNVYFVSNPWSQDHGKFDSNSTICKNGQLFETSCFFIGMESFSITGALAAICWVCYNLIKAPPTKLGNSRQQLKREFSPHSMNIWKHYIYSTCGISSWVIVYFLKYTIFVKEHDMPSFADNIIGREDEEEVNIG